MEASKFLYDIFNSNSIGYGSASNILEPVALAKGF